MAATLVQAQAWFRARGLPQVLPAAQRRRSLLRRSAPVFAGLFVQDVFVQAMAALWARLDAADPAQDTLATLSLAIGLGLLLSRSWPCWPAGRSGAGSAGRRQPGACSGR